MTDQVVDTTIEQVQAQDQPVKQVDQSNVEIPKEKLDEIQRKAYGYAFGQVDERLAEIGLPKPDGMKTTDYIVKLLTEKKSEPVGTKEPAQKVEDTDATARVKALQDALKAKESELEQVKTSIAQQKRDLWVDSIITSTPIATPDYLSEQEKERWNMRQRSLIKSELLSSYDLKEVEGKFRFYTKDGSPVLDGTIEMNPITPQSLIEREFSELIKSPLIKKEAVKGTGVTDAPTKTEPQERVIPSKVKTATEFYAYLREELKLVMGSPEFKDKLSKAKAERPAMFN